MSDVTNAVRYTTNGNRNVDSRSLFMSKHNVFTTVKMDKNVAAVKALTNILQTNLYNVRLVKMDCNKRRRSVVNILVVPVCVTL